MLNFIKNLFKEENQVIGLSGLQIEKPQEEKRICDYFKEEPVLVEVKSPEQLEKLYELTKPFEEMTREEHREEIKASYYKLVRIAREELCLN